MTAARRVLRRLWRRRASIAAGLLIGSAALSYLALRPATLRVTSFPPAQVTIDGEAIGMTPVELSLAPGRHSIRIGRSGFGEYASELDLSAGTSHDVHQVLSVQGDHADSMKAICCLADELGIRIEQAPDETIPSDDQPALVPAGDVRPDDLATYRIHLPRTGELDGTLVFARGGDILHEEPLHLVSGSAEGDVPEHVRAVLRAGDEVRWGFVQPGPSAAVWMTSARVTTFDAQAELRRIEDRLRGQPESVVRHLQAEVLLSRGLYVGALSTAERIHGTGVCADRAREIRHIAATRLSAVVAESLAEDRPPPR